MKRTFAVGDIHGHAVLLDRLLLQLRERAEPGDRLVFIGDYIDRGPDSRGVIDRVMELRGGVWDGPVVTLRGNHEDMLLDEWRETRQYDLGLWRVNGGRETLESYLEGVVVTLTTPSKPAIPAEHREFIGGTAYWFEDEHAYYVHAGFRPRTLPSEVDEFDLLWIRTDFIESDYAWDKPVVFGHTPMFEGLMLGRGPVTNWQPLNRPEKIGIDTGVCYGGRLTAVMLPEREFFTVGGAE